MYLSLFRETYSPNDWVVVYETNGTDSFMIHCGHMEDLDKCFDVYKIVKLIYLHNDLVALELVE